MSLIRLECTTGGHNKFWECEVIGTQTKTSYGRIGKTPRNAVKDLRTKEKAQKYYEKKVSEKKKEGYKVVKSCKDRDEEDNDHDEDDAQDVLDHALGLLSSLKVPPASRKAKAAAMDACKKLAATLGESSKRARTAPSPPGAFLKLREAWGDASNNGLMDSATYLVSDFGVEPTDLSDVARLIWNSFLKKAFPNPKDGNMYGEKAYVSTCEADFTLLAGSASEQIKEVIQDGILDGVDTEISETFQGAFGSADNVQIAGVGDEEQIRGYVAAGQIEDFLFGWALLCD